MAKNGVDFGRKCRRIAVHDYCGHPFQFQLSRELARRGFEVRHFFFADDMGPKGSAQRLPNDPANFSIEAISLDRPYSKQNLIRRHQADIQYGKLASQRIASFAPDVVLSGNTPLDAQASILAEAHNAGSAFVFWMQDFYSIAAGRILSRKLPILGHGIGAYYKHLEAKMLRRSDAVVLISDDFKAELGRMGVNSGAAEVIPNWGALEELPVRPKDNAWAKAHGLSDKFVFLYSGTLALKHDPNMLLALAERFESDPKVALVVAASGVNFEALKARCVSERRSNVVLLPLQPMEVFPDVLGSADVFVALLEKDAGAFSVPSKVLNYLCAGRPVLLSAPLDNLAVRIVENAAAGICVPADDREAFVEAAVRLRKDSEARLELGRASRAYAENTFNVSAIADRFEGILTGATLRRRARRAPGLRSHPASAVQRARQDERRSGPKAAA